MEFLAVIAGIWFWGGMLASFYFWARKTDRSEAPIVRRTKAMGYGLAWPYLMYQHFAGKSEADVRAREREQRSDSIFGSGATSGRASPTPPPASANVPPPVPRPSQSSSRVANPFDQR